MKKVSVTISGGGVRSIAGLGVLKYLEENNIEVVALSGNSGGAMVALLYSYGISIEEIEQFTKDIDKFKLFRPSLSSFFSLLGVEEQLRKILEGKKQKIPLTVVTTDINKMKEVYHSDGDMIKKTIASSSVYTLFSPIELDDGSLHVDGLYVDNLPNKFLVNKKVKNISINVNNPSLNQDTTKRLYKIKERAGINFQASQADVFLDVIEIADVRLLDLSKFSFCIDAGYNLAKEKLKDFDYTVRK